MDLNIVGSSLVQRGDTTVTLHQEGLDTKTTSDVKNQINARKVKVKACKVTVMTLKATAVILKINFH